MNSLLVAAAVASLASAQVVEGPAPTIPAAAATIAGESVDGFIDSRLDLVPGGGAATESEILAGLDALRASVPKDSLSGSLLIVDIQASLFGRQDARARLAGLGLSPNTLQKLVSKIAWMDVHSARSPALAALARKWQSETEQVGPVEAEPEAPKVRLSQKVLDEAAWLSNVLSARPQEVGELLAAQEGDEASKRWLAGEWVAHAHAEADKVHFEYSHDWKFLLQGQTDGIRQGRALAAHVETVRQLSRTVVERPDLFEKIPSLPSLLKKSIARLQLVSRGFGALEPALQARGAVLMKRVQQSLVEAALAVEALLELRSPEPGLRPLNLAWHFPTSELAHLWEGTRRIYSALFSKLNGTPEPIQRKRPLNERLVALAGIASTASSLVAAIERQFGLAFALLGAVVLCLWSIQKLRKRNDRLEASRKAKESQPWHIRVDPEIVVELEQAIEGDEEDETVERVSTALRR